jgi:hypothetical protein
MRGSSAAIATEQQNSPIRATIVMNSPDVTAVQIGSDARLDQLTS